MTRGAFLVRCAGPIVFATLVAGFVAAAARAEGAPIPRHGLDAQDLTRLRLLHPGAVAHFDKGEELAMQGQTAEALAHFAEASKNAPESALAARRECQALTILGRRPEAIQACLRALKAEGSAMDMRATVAAQMSGNDPPLTGEVAQAMRLARRARDTMPQEPWGYAAECDIAERIADADMLESCLAGLKRVAPHHYETTRAFARAAPHGVTWPIIAGWSAIALLGFGTAVHALARALGGRWGRRRGANPAMVSAGVMLAMVAGSATWNLAQADDSAEPSAPAAAPMPSSHKGMMSDWPVDDSDPESSVPTDARRNRNPLQFGYWLMDLAYKGVQATKRGDHLAAVKYYKAMAKAVPDRSVSFTRLCESYEAAGDWKNAVETCATALTRPGVTANDYQHYFTLALQKKGTLTAPEVETLSNVVDHVRADADGKPLADDLECQLGVRIEDVARLKKCTAALAARAPDDPRTISYEWALAMKLGHFGEARALLARAQSAGLKPEGVAQMELAMRSLQSAQRFKWTLWTLAGLAVVAALAIAAGLTARRRPLARTPA